MKRLLNKFFSPSYIDEEKFILNNNNVCRSKTDEGLLAFAQTVHSLLDGVSSESGTPDSDIHPDTVHNSNFAKSTAS